MRLFDELNEFSEDEILDIDTYFEEMELSEEGKEERKKFSKEFSKMLLFIFALFEVMKEHNHIDKNLIISQIKSGYSEIAKKFIKIEKFLDGYIEDFSQEVTDATLNHGAEDYWISKERSIIISVNEANTVLGYRQLQEAIENGYTRKRWITEKDSKVRKTHREVDDKIISIFEYFQVGNSNLLYPHDNVSDLGIYAEAKEICGCRCTVEYLK